MELRTPQQTKSQESPQHKEKLSPRKTVSEKLNPFKEKLSPRVVEIITADKTEEANYKITVVDNQYSPGIIHTTETWDGGARFTRSFDERYQSKSKHDHQVGDFDVSTSVGNEPRSIGISIDIQADGSLRQKISCTTEAAQNTSYNTEPVMQGKFFGYAGPGPMTEEVFINPDGKVSRKRSWYESKWLGQHDRYRTRMVTQEDNVIRSGTGEHGIVLGYVPEMRVVEPK